MKKMLVALSVGLLSSSAFASSLVKYPDGYREWTHVKSMTIHEGHPLENPFKGIHHIYANDKAMKGLKNGNYKKGAVIVFDLLDYEQADHTTTESSRKLIGVMTKDSKKYKETGGWGFEAFAGDSQDKRVVTDGGKSCFGCHASKRDADFVFSEYRK